MQTTLTTSAGAAVSRLLSRVISPGVGCFPAGDSRVLHLTGLVSAAVAIDLFGVSRVLTGVVLVAVSSGKSLRGETCLVGIVGSLLSFLSNVEIAAAAVAAAAAVSSCAVFVVELW